MRKVSCLLLTQARSMLKSRFIVVISWLMMDLLVARVGAVSTFAVCTMFMQNQTTRWLMLVCPLAVHCCWSSNSKVL